MMRVVAERITVWRKKLMGDVKENYKEMTADNDEQLHSIK